jgi:hypothetical protein
MPLIVRTTINIHSDVLIVDPIVCLGDDCYERYEAYRSSYRTQ